MQSTFSHLLQVVSHSRTLLCNGKDNNHDTPIESRAIKSLDFVHLYENKGVIERDIIASNTHEWVCYLRKTGHTEVLAHYFPSNNPLADWMTAGLIGGGGQWVISTNNGRWSDYWQPKWTMSGDPYNEQPKWQVEYGRVIRGNPGKPPRQASIRSCRRALLQSMSDIYVFAKEKNLPDFQPNFHSALDILTNKNHIQNNILDKFPMRSSAHRLASAAERAWVFGAQGWWNDQYFVDADQIRFERLSGDLYRDISNSLIAAANSTGPRWWRGIF
jgi:hypothetical protein